MDPLASQHKLAIRITLNPGRRAPEHGEQMVAADAQVGGREALGRKGGQARHERDHSAPDQLLLAVAEAQHGLHHLAIARQHELACARRQG